MFQTLDVPITVAGGNVTGVDAGLPDGAYQADGSQVDPLTNISYPVGTWMIDEFGRPTPVETNLTTTPPVTVNTTRTWETSPVTLKRTSLIFERPTEYGRFHQPLNWDPVDEIIEDWGTLQLVFNGQDVTYFRDHPAEPGGWAKNEPNGDVGSSVYFPQISWYERTGHGELAWTRGGSRVDYILHRPNGTRKTLFEGIVVGQAYSGQGVGVTLNIVGTLYQADHTPYIQELYERQRDVGTAIADIMDATIARNFVACNRPYVGIPTYIRGSGKGRLTQGVQDLLSTAFTADATNQWTITNLPGRRPWVKLKDKTTKHWSMSIGNPHLSLDIAEDFQEAFGMIWGSGTSPNGGTWYNAKYPGTRVDAVPSYPLGVGAVFAAGSGATGFDEFADELRTRGYNMQSRDTYDADDYAEVRDMQRTVGITVDGVVGAQTWNAAFGVGGEVLSTAGAHIAPLAAVPWNIQFLENPDGSIKGPNPRWEPDFLAVGKLVEYGSDVTKKQATGYARGEIQARIDAEPLWVGSATLDGDPEEGSRWEIEDGQNIFFKHFFPPNKLIGVEDGLLLHISQVTVTPGGSVSLSLSYLGHDMTTLASIRRHMKNMTDPARRATDTRDSKITKDRAIPWDEEAGGGKVPKHNLQGGLWTVYRIPAAKIGRIVETRFVCGTGITTSTLSTAFDTTAPVSGAQHFVAGVFGENVTSNELAAMGNPLDDFWKKNAVKLAKMKLQMAYGTGTQPAGYWPEQAVGAGGTTGTKTGKMLDGTSWEWISDSPPYLWVAEYCPVSTKIAGQLRNGVLGS